jgi:fructose-1-phosphate kinase PfkB-like protein
VTVRITFKYWSNYTEDETPVNVDIFDVEEDVTDISMRMSDAGYGIHVSEIISRFNEFLNAAGYNGKVTYTP